jgi:hypothetical protein
MKTKLERFIRVLILAPLAPLALFLGGWWLAYFILPEKWIPLGAILGFILGLLTDIFLFYSVGLFGFFMGVPIFNLALAIPAGFILGSRLASQRADEIGLRSVMRRAAGFTTIVLAFICMASAIIALADPYTAANLQGMFRLRFDVTRGMIIGLIVIGGALLLILNWLLASASVRFTYKFLKTAA